jgi:hypothetical protein
VDKEAVAPLVTSVRFPGSEDACRARAKKVDNCARRPQFFAFNCISTGIKLFVFSQDLFHFFAAYSSGAYEAKPA